MLSSIYQDDHDRWTVLRILYQHRRTHALLPISPKEVRPVSRLDDGRFSRAKANLLRAGHISHRVADGYIFITDLGSDYFEDLLRQNGDAVEGPLSDGDAPMSTNNAGDSTPDIAARHQADRNALLERLYTLANGDSRQRVAIHFLQKDLGWEGERHKTAFKYLRAKGLLTHNGAEFSITADGIDYVEQLHGGQKPSSEPRREGVSITVTGPNYGQILAAGNNGVQSLTVAVDDKKELVALINELMKLVAKSAHSSEQTHLVDAELQTMLAQLKAPAPKKGILDACWASAKAALENLVGTLAASGAMSAAPAVMAQITQLLGG